MKYRYLLFDLDGTLTDSAPGITRCAGYALEKMGVGRQDPETLRSFIGPPLTDSFMELCGMTRDEADRAVELYRERYREKGIFEQQLYEGIRELLQDLQGEGRILIVASSKPEVYVRSILERFGIAKYFHHIVGATLDGRLSAKKEILEEVFARCEEAGRDPSKVIMIGDRRYDVEGAVSMNIDSIGVYYGFADPGELEMAGATYTVGTVGELAELLREI